MANFLVAYFSAGGVTKVVAENLAKVLNSDVYEIKPKVPYTEEDLNWMDKNSRSTVEMKDKSFRPEMVEDDFSVENYDVIFLGFPIWWYVAPTIVNTFLEKYDFADKKIILFATSGGSGFGNTIKELKISVDETCIIEEGKLLKGNTSLENIKDWIDILDL